MRLFRLRHLRAGRAAQALSIRRSGERQPARRPFFATRPRANRLRPAFVTVPPDRIDAGIALLGELIEAAIAGTAGVAG